MGTAEERELERVERAMAKSAGWRVGPLKEVDPPNRIWVRVNKADEVIDYGPAYPPYASDDDLALKWARAFALENNLYLSIEFTPPGRVNIRFSEHGWEKDREWTGAAGNDRLGLAVIRSAVKHHKVREIMEKEDA